MVVPQGHQGPRFSSLPVPSTSDRGFLSQGSKDGYGAPASTFPSWQERERVQALAALSQVGHTHFFASWLHARSGSRWSLSFSVCVTVSCRREIPGFRAGPVYFQFEHDLNKCVTLTSLENWKHPISKLEEG